MICSPQIHTNLLWDLTLLFGGLGLIYFIVIFFFRNKIVSKNTKIKESKKNLSPMISEFIFYDENANKAEKSNYLELKIEIRELIKDDFNRKLLSEILLDLQKDLSGDAAIKLYKLYQDLGLHLDAFTKLKSWRWEIVSQGIFELTKMQVVGAYTFITKFINDRRSVIRKQAEVAAVTLKKDGINYFLDTTTFKISEWQQLKLLEVIRNHKDYNPPRFKNWLTSSNKDVVLFALRLIKFYDQNDANKAITELVRHKNNQIKEEAINCIKKFNVIEALDDLKKIFWKSKVDTKILILDTISFLGTDNDIPFLQSVEKKSTDFLIKSKAQSAINVIVPGSIMPSKGIEDISLERIENDEQQIVLENQVTPNIEEENSSIDYSKEDTTITEAKEIVEDILVKEEESNLEEFSELSKERMDEILSEFDFWQEEDQVLEESEMDFLPFIVDQEIEESKKIDDSIFEKTKEGEKVETFNLEEKEDTIVKALAEEKEETTTVYASETKEKKVSKNIFDNNFFEQDNYNKILLLDTLEDIGGPEDCSFLKEIIEKEENEDIQERALEIYNDFSDFKYNFLDEKDITIIASEDNDPSIFKHLFDTSDKDSKLILLDQILEIGGDKEIQFLNSLVNVPEKRVKEKVIQVKNILEKKGNSSITVEVEKQRLPINKRGRLFTQKSAPISLFQTIEYNPLKAIEKSKENSSKKLIPMEFCFLMDELEIELAKPSTIFDVDFELTQEFYNNQKNVKQNK